ncbi:MAG: AbrB/MazE/SpoVT family DNA-binding domain-containing protein [Acidimicrobiia bacterium]|nr:AbrB/MazE/SpoVT family DNA-binding domain-containing protein [Acidimicrobiia bacterium]MYF83169.1 AbrB/MazE/SpoVT family DNA-binding domain-containing protein [Acidimicrobiia bacterium]
MIESTITSKGQTTLPKAVREALSVNPGDRVRYVVNEGQVRLLGVRPINRLYGVLRHHGPAATLEDMDDAIAEGATGA